MGDKTGTEWSDSTWNPTTGCVKVSPGCKHCYARHQAWPRLAAQTTGVYAGRRFEEVACHPERLDQPLRWRRPRRICVNSMSDLFHETIPDAFIDRVFAVMALTPQHIFQVLTKRAERMSDYLQSGAGRIIDNVERFDCYNPGQVVRGQYDTATTMRRDNWPIRNVSMGVSVENQACADERIPALLAAPAAVRFLSCEPLLGDIDLAAYLHPHGMDVANCPAFYDVCRCGVLGRKGLHWVIAGGESGPNARPMSIQWARALRDQCRAAGLPFLFKQFGEWLPPGQVGLIDGRLRPNPEAESIRIGKRAAGRELDGRLWDEYPPEPGRP
jgi:protein gp37